MRALTLGRGWDSRSLVGQFEPTCGSRRPDARPSDDAAQREAEHRLRRPGRRRRGRLAGCIATSAWPRPRRSPTRDAAARATASTSAPASSCRVPATSRPDRPSHRQLTPAGRHSRQQQIRDVEARNGRAASSPGAEQQQHGRTRRGGELLAQRDHGGLVDIHVLVAVALLQGVRERMLISPVAAADGDPSTTRAIDLPVVDVRDGLGAVELAGRSSNRWRQGYSKPGGIMPTIGWRSPPTRCAS